MCESDFSTVLEAGSQRSRCAVSVLRWLLQLINVMSSHVNRVTRLVELVVGCEVRVHLARMVLEAIKTRRTLAVDDVLVVTLGLVVRVTEDLAALGLLRALRLRKALVKHVLIVLDEGGVAAELVVESVLRVGENITLVGQGGSVRRAAVRLRHLVVLAQV